MFKKKETSLGKSKERHLCKSNGSQINRRRTAQVLEFVSTPPSLKNNQTKSWGGTGQKVERLRLTASAVRRDDHTHALSIIRSDPKGGRMRMRCRWRGKRGQKGRRNRKPKFVDGPKGTRACAADKRTDCRTVAFRRAAHTSREFLQGCVLHEHPNSNSSLGCMQKKKMIHCGERRSNPNATFY